MINTKTLTEFIDSLFNLYPRYFTTEDVRREWGEQYKMSILNKAKHREVNYSKLLQEIMNTQKSMTTPPSPASVIEVLPNCYIYKTEQIGKVRRFKHRKTGAIIEFVEVDWANAPTKEKIESSGYVEI